MTPASQTQRIDIPDDMPSRCINQLYRIDMLEDRMNRVEERMIDIDDLKTLVKVLSERVRLILWVIGVTSAATITGLVGVFLKLLQAVG